MGDERKLRQSPVHGTSGQTPERRAPKALLHTRVRGHQPSHSGSPEPGPRGPSARAQLGVRRVPPAAPLTLVPRSILLGCRSRPRRGSPCPTGGRTQTRSPARGSPGERGAGSILPGKPRARVRAGGGDRPPCSAQTRLLPWPPPRASPAAHLPTPGQPRVPRPSPNLAGSLSLPPPERTPIA